MNKKRKQSKNWVKKGDILQAVLNDPYSTTRKSSANWRKWVNILTFQKVEAIQNICGKMMRAMGYNEVKDEAFLNTTELLSDFCHNQTLTFC